MCVCLLLRVCVLICVCVPVLCLLCYSICLHAFSLPQSCMVFTSVVLTTFVSSPPLYPSSFYHPDPTHSASACVSICFSLSLSFLFFPVCLFLVLSVSHSRSVYPFCLSTILLHLPRSPFPLLPRSPSLDEGPGRASLIGSVWWWRQSDLEWVTDEVRSARCLSSTAAAAVTALIYVAQPVEPIHTCTY